MAKFIWTATDKHGMEVVREINADSIEDSKAFLLAEGCTDLKLKTDDIMDAVGAGFSDETSLFGGKEEVYIPVEERLKNLENLPQTTLGQIFDRVVRDKLFYLLAIPFSILEYFYGQKTFAIVIGIAVIGWFVFSIWMALPEIYYAKLNKALDWHQWTEVLRLIKISQIIRRFHFIRLPETELKRYEAMALAGLGNLPDALEKFRACENQPGMPGWLYNTFLAEIYGIAKEYDKSLSCLWKVVNEKPTPTLHIDLMHRLLHPKKDIIKAREVLAEIEKGTLPEIAKPFVMRCRGILAYLEGDHAMARRELEASLEILQQNMNQPFRDGHVSATKAYLCCVLARQGDMNRAKQYFAQAKTYLVATQETDLIEECKKAMGS